MTTTARLLAQADRHVARWGESVIYTKRSDSSNPLPLMAVIDRGSADTDRADQHRSLREPIEAFFSKNDLDAVDINGDTVTVKRHLHDAQAAILPVTAILEDDAGGWRLALGR